MASSREQSTRTPLPARKHLAYLGQFVLGVFLTALFFQLRIWDSQVHREDFESITALASLAELPIHRVLTSSDQPSQLAAQFDKAVQGAVQSWLAGNQSELDQAHRHARDTVVEWLQGSGFTTNEAGSLSGKGRGDRIPFLLFRTDVGPLSSRFSNEASVVSTPPIGLLLDEVRHLGAPVTLRVVHKVKRSDLPQLKLRLTKNTVDRFATPKQAGQKSYQLTSIILNDSDRLIATFVEDVGVSQRSPEYEQYSIPVATQEVAVPSILELVSSRLHAHGLATIASNEERYNRLYETYGRLRLENARTMTGNRMLDSFQDVEILGFKFSPRYFWIFAFAFLAAALLAIAVHLKRALPNDEPTAFGLDALMENVACRVVLWCVMPSVALLLAQPQDTSSRWILAGYWTAFASVFMTGAWLVWLSIHLFRGNERPENERSECLPVPDGVMSAPTTKQRQEDIAEASAGTSKTAVRGT